MRCGSRAACSRVAAHQRTARPRNDGRGQGRPTSDHASRSSERPSSTAATSSSVRPAPNAGARGPPDPDTGGGTEQIAPTSPRIGVARRGVLQRLQQSRQGTMARQSAMPGNQRHQESARGAGPPHRRPARNAAMPRLPSAAKSGQHGECVRRLRRRGIGVGLDCLGDEEAHEVGNSWAAARGSHRLHAPAGPTRLGELGHE